MFSMDPSIHFITTLFRQTVNDCVQHQKFKLCLCDNQFLGYGVPHKDPLLPQIREIPGLESELLMMECTNPLHPPASTYECMCFQFGFLMEETEAVFYTYLVDKLDDEFMVNVGEERVLAHNFDEGAKWVIEQIKDPDNWMEWLRSTNMEEDRLPLDSFPNMTRFYCIKSSQDPELLNIIQVHYENEYRRFEEGDICTDEDEYEDEDEDEDEEESNDSYVSADM